MAQIDFKTYIAGVKNDLSIALDDVFNILARFSDDIEELKNNSKPKEKN